MTAKLTTEQFITKANAAHGELYNYGLVDYKTNATKIKIICPIHGSFLQTPNSHLNGSGCPQCTSILAKQTKAAESFITKASVIHNNKYDYSRTVYTRAKDKVQIVCPIHGIYEQRASSHLAGVSCPVCGKEESGFTRTKFKEHCIKNNNGLGILYVLECFNDTERFYKIGITSRSIKERYRNKTTMPYLYRVIDEIIGDPVEIYNLETKIHQINKENHYVPEIPFGGSSSECFKEYKEII